MMIKSQIFWVLYKIVNTGNTRMNIEKRCKLKKICTFSVATVVSFIVMYINFYNFRKILQNSTQVKTTGQEAQNFYISLISKNFLKL